MPATTTPTIEQLLEQGQEHHRKNRLNEAEAAFRQILTRQPMHADALYYLGAVMFGRNQAMSAIEDEASEDEHCKGEDRPHCCDLTALVAEVPRQPLG